MSLPGGHASLSFIVQAGECLVPAAGARGSRPPLPASASHLVPCINLSLPASSLPVQYCYKLKATVVTTPFRHSSIHGDPWSGAAPLEQDDALLAPGPASRIMRLQPPPAARRSELCKWGAVVAQGATMQALKIIREATAEFQAQAVAEAREMVSDIGRL
jgi:hypothetical protein